ncbi:hypothetical protein CC79DRAFT_1338648 [Sarocladium strictum]
MSFDYCRLRKRLCHLLVACTALMLVYAALTWKQQEYTAFTYSSPGANNHGLQNASRLFAEFWGPSLHPIDNPVFTTDKGERFEVPRSSRRWLEPLGKKVVIIDTDTRLDTAEKNTILHASPLDYKRLEGRTGGHLNHYLYTLIHGYDYRIVRAPEYPDRYGTWVKPAILKEALKTHEFVIILDSDAVFTHLQLPIEWLMNLWDIRNETLIAMAEDLDNELDYDPLGKLVLNTGFVIAMASERTQEMITVWNNCPDKIDGCGKWKTAWAHEQAAFSYFIRYLFNKPNEVKTIPCDHANGNEYYENGHGACRGVFVSHNWHTKDKTVEILQQNVARAMVQRLHGQFQADQQKLFIDGSRYSYPIEDMQI